MALAEYAAIETAYGALAELDPVARTRALGWLADALAGPGLLPQAPIPVAKDRVASADSAMAPVAPALSRGRVDGRPRQATPAERHGPNANPVLLLGGVVALRNPSSLT